jgi:hypothetical protein
MNERIRTTIVRLNEAKAFCRIEPLNCSGVHDEPFRKDYK